MNSNKIIRVYNPIIKSDYPDPDIICAGDAFYMVTTTMHFLPGGQILRSFNLRDWEIAGYVFDCFEGTEEAKLSNDHCNYGCGMWAPSFRYHEGRFYISFGAKETQKTYIFTATDVEGPWEKHVFDTYFHDASLFFDEGRVFYVHGNSTIWLTELEPDLSAVKKNGIHKVLLEEKNDVYLGYEGSHIYKIDGKYHLFLIHWPKSNGRRTQSWFCSDSLCGEYTGKDIFYDNCGYMDAGIAQGGILQANNGKWYTILMQDHGAVGRVPYLVPMKWENGEPVVGEEGRVPNYFELPSNRPFYNYEPLNTSDDFCYQTDKYGHCELKKQWQWNHEPNPEFWNVDFRGGYRITTGKICTNVTQAINTLTQRFIYPKCAASVTVDASDLNEGDHAGLLALLGCYGFLAVTCELRRFYLDVIARPLAEKNRMSTSGDFMPGKVVERISLNGPVVKIKIEATFGGEKDFVKFFYKEEREGGKWRQIGESHEMSFGLDHFCGARVGLAAYSTKKIGGSALFTNFVFEG